MSKAAAGYFTKMAGAEFDKAKALINEAFDTDDIRAAGSLSRTYQLWAAKSDSAGNVWAILAEYAAAALESLEYVMEMRVPCKDCGQLTVWNHGDSEFEADGKRVPVAICRQCGDSREFRHSTGRYYDAFA